MSFVLLVPSEYSVQPSPWLMLTLSQDDASEIDIEAVTKGTSIVNNTINYSTQPSVNADGTRIPNATLSIPLSEEYNTNLEVFHEHRFDCDKEIGAKFYLDGKLMQVDGHNVPKLGGNLQLKLWADGSEYWTGYPSSTTVTMSVKSIIAYFNISRTQDGTDKGWLNTCSNAGGPSDKTICEAYAEVGKDDDLPLAASGRPASQPASTQASSTRKPSSTQELSSTRAGSRGTTSATGSPVESATCLTKVGMGGTCLATGQAVRVQPVGLGHIHRVFSSVLSRLADPLAGRYNEARSHLSPENPNHTCYLAACGRVVHFAPSLSYDFLAPLGNRSDEIGRDFNRDSISSLVDRRSSYCYWPCAMKSPAAQIRPPGVTKISPSIRQNLQKLKARFAPSFSGSEVLIANVSANGTLRQCILDPTGPSCHQQSQGIRVQPPGFGMISYMSEITAELKSRFPPASSDPVDFGSRNSTENTTQDCLTVAKGEGCLPLKNQAAKLMPRILRQRMVLPAVLPESYSSQGVRTIPPAWSRIQKYLSTKFERILSRDEPTYSLPFGSPVEYDEEDDKANSTSQRSQAVRARPPPWFNTLYARNSTPVAFRAKQSPLGTNVQTGKENPEKRARLQKAQECEQNKSEHCSFGRVWDLGKWWQCLNNRSDWCFFFSGSSFLLTNGLIQVISVPVMFAWVFYLTEM